MKKCHHNFYKQRHPKFMIIGKYKEADQIRFICIRNIKLQQDIFFVEFVTSNEIKRSNTFLLAKNLYI